MVSVSRRVRSLVVAVAVLAVAVQGGAATLLWRYTRPRLPALTTVAPTLDRSIAAVVAAVGDSAAVAVTDVVASTSCQNTLFAQGSRFTRTADLYTNPGSEGAVVDRISAALPATDRQHRGAPTGGHAAPLTADLGGGASLQVSQIAQGWLAATAQTGCRAAGHPLARATAPAAATTAITQVLAGLGTAPADWHTDTVDCPSGQIVTVATESRGTNADGLPTRLSALVPAGARRFTSPSNRLSWRDASTSVIVAASDDGTHITIQRTTTC
jgi:hypothetical protein